MSIKSIIQGASAGAVPATVEPQGVDFDGTYDYLSRSTDLVGNVDSKTFTFSAWVYSNDFSTTEYYACFGGTKFVLYRSGVNTIRFQGRNSAGTDILVFTITINPKQTFTHFLISIDLANTSTRSVYVNDILQTVTWSTYTNDLIDFTTAQFGLGASDLGATKLKGRLSNIFLAYEYVDLSIESNRRMFITADGKPA